MGTRGNGLPASCSRFALNEFEAVLKWLFLGAFPRLFCYRYIPEAQQLDQVCRSRWRLQVSGSHPESVLSLFDLFYQNESRIYKGMRKCRQSPRFKPFKYSKIIKPLLKCEVSNEMSFTSLRSYNQIYIACYMQYIGYTFLVKDEQTLHEILTHLNVHIRKVSMPPSHSLIFPFDPLEWVNY